MTRGRSLTIVAAALVAAGAGLPAPATAAGGGEPGRDHVPGEVVVGLTGGGERVVEVPEGGRMAAAIDRLERRAGVAYAHRNWRVRAAYRPLDRGSSDELEGWRREQWSFLARPGGVRALPAWRRLAELTPPRPGAAGVTVAVLDTGIAFTDERPGFAISPGFTAQTSFHPGRDLIGAGPPVDRNGHGTHIAGTIAEQVTLEGAAPPDAPDYLTGLAHNATLMPVRVLNANGTGTTADVARGIRWAANNGAAVINVSLQASQRVRRCAQVRALCRAVRHATRQGALVVAAAGNAGNADPARILFPAAAPGALAVGASTEGGCLAAYSHYGRRLDLLAPGGGRPRAAARRPGCTGDRRAIRQVSFECYARGCRLDPTRFAIREVAGTSMAAAHVSGVAAMARAAGAPPRRLAERLICSARPLGRPRFHGSGLLDAARSTSPQPPARCAG